MSRCTPRKHVIERTRSMCDCGEMLFGMTAAKNAFVVTILDPVQADALARMAPARLTGSIGERATGLPSGETPE